MAVTAALRKQHAEIIEVVRAIEAALDPQRLAKSATDMWEWWPA